MNSITSNFVTSLRCVICGMMISVSDEEILRAQRVLGQKAGVFGEPSGAAALAGLQKAVINGEVSKDASALAVITGSGLKDVQSILRVDSQACLIDANIESVAALVHASAI